jgi:hypothetical protein
MDQRDPHQFQDDHQPAPVAQRDAANVEVATDAAQRALDPTGRARVARVEPSQFVLVEHQRLVRGDPGAQFRVDEIDPGRGNRLQSLPVGRRVLRGLDGRQDFGIPHPVPGGRVHGVVAEMLLAAVVDDPGEGGGDRLGHGRLAVGHDPLRDPGLLAEDLLDRFLVLAAGWVEQDQLLGDAVLDAEDLAQEVARYSGRLVADQGPPPDRLAVHDDRLRPLLHVERGDDRWAEAIDVLGAQGERVGEEAIVIDHLGRGWQDHRYGGAALGRDRLGVGAQQFDVGRRLVRPVFPVVRDVVVLAQTASEAHVPVSALGLDGVVAMAQVVVGSDRREPSQILRRRLVGQSTMRGAGRAEAEGVAAGLGGAFADRIAAPDTHQQTGDVGGRKQEVPPGARTLVGRVDVLTRRTVVLRVRVRMSRVAAR